MYSLTTQYRTIVNKSTSNIPLSSCLGDALIHASFPLILYGAGLFHPLMLLAPLANYTFLRCVGGETENEKNQEEKYLITDAKKWRGLRRYQIEKNSFWPGLIEVKNHWTWIVVAAGVVGVGAEWAVRRL